MTTWRTFYILQHRCSQPTCPARYNVRRPGPEGVTQCSAARIEPELEFWFKLKKANEEHRSTKAIWKP